MDSTTKECAEVNERLAEILDGTAEERLYEHVANCDVCRDARHEAERLRDVTRDAGADYREPSDLEARLERALGERDEDTEAAPQAPEPGKARPNPRDPKRPAPIAEPHGLPSAHKLRWVAGGLLAAAAAVLMVRGAGTGSEPSAPSQQRSGGAWRGVVERVARGSGDGGVKLCDAGGSNCRGLAQGAEFPAGALLTTDERTRARVRLSDGTIVTLERSTELALLEGARHARLVRGALTADVTHAADEARIDLPRGAVAVHGTKFALRAEETTAAVDVARGSVTLSDAERRSVRVNAGESARLAPGAPPFVSFSESFGQSLAWSDETFAETETETAASPRGLGELKAKKPGQDAERTDAVTLASHAVRVRIAGAIARTEIEEVFENHTDEVLEGIYRFPMPPDAQIERLALDVDGKLEEGAFLDRERAAGIWRGAIVNAAPQARRPLDDIVWVPGPWRDPALLEWQRGGRFELRIFPIPKRGSRRVVLAYTEIVKASGNTRRYTYPLAYDPSGSTRVGRFDVDVEVRGNDAAVGVRPLGYALTRRESAGTTGLGFSAQGFAPSGDLTLEYALPHPGAELTTFAYHESSGKLAAGTSGPSKSIPPEAEDGSPYVALAIKPKLPRAERETHRAVAVVVDASRSMLGESYRRASELAARLARELDESDRVTVLACDVECRTLPGGLLAPGVAASANVARFLSGITPEGGSDLVAAVRKSLEELERAGGRRDGRSLRVVYVGDGAPTVGEVRPGTIERAVLRSVDRSRASVTTVAVGAESDGVTLAAVSRGGGGVVLPYSPGRSVAETAYAVLGATYGQALTNVEVTLPEGFRAVAPQRIDSIPAGGEAFVVARMNNLELSGDVVVKGLVGAKAFERRYPIRIAADDVRGNAFVPRLYAAARIADLEREGTADAKRTAIALSGRFNVASRYTSLLVLESAAMFKAFGLDNTRFSPLWSGEEEAKSESSKDDAAFADELGEDGDGAAPGSLSGIGTGGGGRGAPAGFGIGDVGAEKELRRAESSAAKKSASNGPAPAPKPAAAAPSSPSASSERGAPIARRDVVLEPSDEPFLPDPEPRRRRMIPMRRKFERTGEVFVDRFAPRAASSSAIAAAELDVERNENRRESVKKLFALLLRAGDVDRAARVSRRWSDKEPLDPDALTARADVLAASGDRSEAIRVLSGVVDVRPGDVAAQKRLARLHRWAGQPELACRYSVAIAEFRASDGALLGEAVRCTRSIGDGALADELLVNAEPATRKSAEALLAAPPPNERELRGDLRVEATWSGGTDLDLALVHPDGHRVSWLGAPTRSVITARDVVSSSGEGLALNNPQAGEYVVELVRARGSGRAVGEVVVTAAGTTRRVPFTLDGTRASVAVANIAVRQVLVPVNF